MAAVLVADGVRLAVQYVQAVLQYLSVCRVIGDTFVTIMPNIYRL
jgi:hypothetical protein